MYQRFIIEKHAFTSAHSAGGTSKIVKDEESLASHLGAFGSNNIDYLAIGSEESKKLQAQFILVDFVVEIIDIKSSIGLVGGGSHNYAAQAKNAPGFMIT